jgi:hypothetical protein
MPPKGRDYYVHGLADLRNSLSDPAEGRKGGGPHHLRWGNLDRPITIETVNR